MGFMFCDLHVSLNNHPSWDINSSNLPCYILIFMYLAMIHRSVRDLSCKANIYVSYSTSER